MLKAPPSKEYKMFTTYIYSTVYLHFCLDLEHSFLSDPVLPAWKVSAELSVVSGGPEKTQKCCFIYFLTGNFQKLFVNHIGVLFFPVIF